MSRRCKNCGEVLLEEIKFCSNCGSLINGLDSVEGVIKDIKRSQGNLKKMEEIKAIIENPKNHLMLNPKKIKNLALKLIIIDFIILILVLNLAVGRIIPLIVGQFYLSFWFISELILSCIWFSFSTFKENEISSGVNALIFHNYVKAIEKFIMALRRNSKELNAWRGLAYLYSDINSNTDAVEACKRGLEIKPHDKILWWILASTYQQNKNNEGYGEAMQKLTDLGLGKDVSIEVRGGFPYFRIKKSGLKTYDEILKKFS